MACRVLTQQAIHAHRRYSNLADGNASPQLFEKMKDVPVLDGKVTLMVQPEEIYTLTTLTTGWAPCSICLPYVRDPTSEALINVPVPSIGSRVIIPSSLRPIFRCLTTRILMMSPCLHRLVCGTTRWVPGRSSVEKVATVT